MAKKRNNKKTDPRAMPVVRDHAAGADLGSTTHWVAGPPGADGVPDVETFGTTTKELHRMASWLLERGIGSIAMESTGIYWIPVFEVLVARGVDVVLVNARHLRNVPGRKTDMLDCQWIQRLHACGLLRGSFRPDQTIAKLRTIWRQHANLVDERVRAVQWMQKSLDQMNVLVHRAVSNLVGVTGLRIVRAIVAGERDPQALAALRERGCKKSREETSIDGISPPAALIIFTELGLDVSAFPSESHFASWLRLAPRLAISGGKPVKKKPNGMGSNRVAGVLRLAAMSLSRSKTALGAYYRHVAVRKGAKVAIFATARKLATLVYRLLRYGQTYVDIGETAYQTRFRTRRLKSITASAKELGFTLIPINCAQEKAVSS